jgi:hypothetical protein
MLRLLLALRSLNVRTVDQAVRCLQIPRWLARRLDKKQQARAPA